MLPAGPALSVNVKSLTVTGFSTNSASLNAKQKSQVGSFMKASTGVEQVTCIGRHSASASALEKSRTRARATSACNFARSYFPGAPRVVRTASSGTRAQFGTVLITLKLHRTSEEQASPQPTITPTQSPQPPITETRKSSLYNYRHNGTVLERKGDADGSWSPGSTPGQVVHPIRLAAFASIRAQQRPTPTASIDWTIGPNVPKGMVDSYRLQANDALRYLPLSGLIKPVQILVVSEKDRRVMEEFWAPFWGAEDAIARHNRALDQFEQNQANRSVGGAAQARTNRATLVTTLGIDFYVGSQHLPESHLLVELVAHELVHVWQYYSFGQAETRNTPGPNIMEFVPCHLMEGGANALGVPISTPFADWHSEAMDVIVRRVQRDLGSPAMTREKIVSYLVESESWSRCEAGYGVGALAHEWLIGSFGAEKFFRLYPEIIKAGKFDTAMRSIYGFGRDEFYERASGYVIEAVTAAR